MANHRAGKRETSRATPSEQTSLVAPRSNTAGKRKAAKPSRASRAKPVDPVVSRRTHPVEPQTTTLAAPAPPTSEDVRSETAPAAPPARTEPTPIAPAPRTAQATSRPAPGARRASSHAAPGTRKASHAAPAAKKGPSHSASAAKRPAAQTAPSDATTRKTSAPVGPSAPSLIGIAALVVAATGAVTVGQGVTGVGADELQKVSMQATALSGSSAVEASGALDSRERAVSRDSQREALQDAAAEQLEAAAEAQAKERNAALAQLAASAEKHADEIRQNLWVLPLANYRLTAGYGESSSLWSSTHTGLDFAAADGTPVMSVANGTITSTGWAGAYGNQIIVTLQDGTEIWYNHLSAYEVSPGDTVRGGETIGYVGSTGNSTGSHLHLEVRPGAGDPVDPYAALVAHGLNP